MMVAEYKNQLNIFLLYVSFALFSILINISSQMLFLSIYHGIYAIELSILIGTIVGLPVRYILEKKYIYSYKAENIKHDTKLFILYVTMALATTIIFWLTEYAFHIAFDSEAMRYLGGFLGLSIGFYIKYNLDKNFVFIEKENVE